ncbi:hypothetical protein COCNU_07G007770 [Cocos nucifera]|uniref:Homeobox domain-containing protein n=1 Tax=Cocos nucifera TaxID=13894 RepID=A0A8K0N4F6_COCNU|nr:hypothetical protein COCNU_07G007770 [Cocos nucifera]
MSDDEDELQLDGPLDMTVAGHDMMGFGPLLPTESERSLMEKGFKSRIEDVREEILRKRRAGKLPGDTTSVLKQWWQQHSKWPYPTEDDKAKLVEETGLQLKQINNWFINQRKRNWHSNSQSATALKSKRRRFCQKTKGSRSYTCLDVWNSPEGQRIRVAFNNLGQPIGWKAAKLSNFLGTIARDGHLAPLNFIDWRAMPHGSKEKMWQLVELKFDIDPIGKDWVLKSLGTKWRNWKAELKAAHYDTHKTDEEWLADCDKMVVTDQWPFLVAYCSSKRGKAHSNTNRANRVHLRFGHTSGTKSFALREEESQLHEQARQQAKSSHGSIDWDFVFFQVMG